MCPVYTSVMKYVTINVFVQKEAFVKYFVVAIKFYVNLHFMVVTVLKVIVLQIIVHVLSMEENAILKDAKIATFKNQMKFDAKI
jgi:hypothetical protein